MKFILLLFSLLLAQSAFAEESKKPKIEFVEIFDVELNSNKQIIYKVFIDGKLFLQSQMCGDIQYLQVVTSKKEIKEY